MPSLSVSHHLSQCMLHPPLLLPLWPSISWAARPTGSSLLFRIIDNRPARGMEEQNGRANATLPLQLLLAATATGAENQTYRFVIISRRSQFPIPRPSVSLCLLSVVVVFFFYLCFDPQLMT